MRVLHFVLQRAFATTLRHQSKLGGMQNPFDAPTYRVGNEIYRRNCPLELVNTASPAAAAEYSVADEEVENNEENEGIGKMASCEDDLAGSSGYEEKEKARQIQNPVVSSDSKAFSPTPHQAQTEPIAQNEDVPVLLDWAGKQSSSYVEIVDNKITSVSEEKEVRLIESVKYDSKEAVYYDSLKIPFALIGLLKGRDAHKQKSLEKQFQCRIYFPKKRSIAAGKKTEIKISSAQSAENVLQCCQAIEIAVEKARKQALPTHFVSIPIGACVGNARIREQYVDLVHRIRADEELPIECKNPDIFMAPGKIHLTVSVLRLFTEEEIEAATRLLDELFKSQALRGFFLDNSSIRLEFPTIEHFKDIKPNKVNVLFARCESERMQKLANTIDDALHTAGLTEKRKTNDVVLHMTVMNTKHLYTAKRVFFDATKLLEKFGQLNFDPIEVKELQLCEMSSTTGMDEKLEIYKSVHEINFQSID